MAGLRQITTTAVAGDTVTHHPAMPYTDLPVFMEELRQNDSISSLALQFLILTTTRTSEVLRAEWVKLTKLRRSGRFLQIG